MLKACYSISSLSKKSNRFAVVKIVLEKDPSERGILFYMQA